MSKYGIENGQRYVPADGSSGCLIVVDAEIHASCDDVVVYDMISGKDYRMDAFKLAMVRYKLVS